MNENQQKMNRPTEDVIDLKEVWNSIVKHIWLVVIAVVVCGVAGFLVTKFAMTPQYEASINMIVNTASNSADGNTNYVSNDSINSAENLVDAYAIIITSNKVMQDVIDTNNLDYTAEELAEMVTVTSINGTQVMKVAVVTPSLDESTRIAKTISQVAPTYVVDAVQAGSCKVVSNVTKVAKPVSPSVTKNTAVAAALGLILALAYIFLKEYTNNTVNNSDDVTNYLSAPVLGVIPNLYQDKGAVANRKLRKEAKTGKGRTADDLTLYAANGMPFNYVESYKSLRTNVNFLASAGNANTFIVTSTVPGETKTNTAVNLAVALASEGKRVCLVDCDLRKPMIHKYLRMGNEYSGLANVLAGKSNLEDCLAYFSDLGITVLAAGAIPPNPTEVLSSQKMIDVVKLLKTSYDYVIIDTPPCSNMADALIVGRIADGAIMVVRSQYAPREAIQLAMQHLKDVDIKIEGVALTCYDSSKDKKSSGYYYAYDYEYYKE